MVSLTSSFLKTQEIMVALTSRLRAQTAQDGSFDSPFGRINGLGWRFWLYFSILIRHEWPPSRFGGPFQDVSTHKTSKAPDHLTGGFSYK